MRITVDHDRDGVRLALSETGVAETRTLADGIAADFDAQGRLVALAIREVARLTGAPDALADITLGLAGGVAPSAAPPAAMPAAPPTLAERAPREPLTWEPEAVAAMEQVPFFQRGAQRRAVVERARARGLSQVTAELVDETGRRR